jgi:hypothetical protein
VTVFGLAKAVAWSSLGAGAWLAVASPGGAPHFLFWVAAATGASAWPAVWLAGRRNQSRAHRVAWAMASSLVVLEVLAILAVAVVGGVLVLASLQRLGLVLGLMTVLLVVLGYRVWRLEEAVQRLTASWDAERQRPPDGPS